MLTSFLRCRHTVPASPMRKCWNRQTGTFEVRVSMTCGFKSHLPHQEKDAGMSIPASFFCASTHSGTRPCPRFDPPNRAKSACRVSRHAAKGETAAHGCAYRVCFPFWEPLRQNFTANRALVAMLLAHNLPQNFPVGVAVVGTCPPTATDFELFRQSGSAQQGGFLLFLQPNGGRLRIEG